MRPNKWLIDQSYRLPHIDWYLLCICEICCVCMTSGTRPGERVVWLTYVSVDWSQRFNRKKDRATRKKCTLCALEMQSKLFTVTKIKRNANHLKGIKTFGWCVVGSGFILCMNFSKFLVILNDIVAAADSQSLVLNRKMCAICHLW